LTLTYIDVVNPDIAPKRDYYWHGPPP
jgi:hypothetical protein